MEGLLAFFLESTFLGLWIFGWGRLSPKVHLATRVAGGVRHRAVGVLHPRRQLVDAAPGRLHDRHGDPPRRADEHLQRAHQLDRAARLPAHDLRRADHRRACWSSASRPGTCCAAATSTFFARSLRLVLPIALVTVLVTLGFGHGQAPLMTTQQPMKMAAAEATLTHDQGRRPLDLRHRAAREAPARRCNLDIRIPHLRVADRDAAAGTGAVPGINNVQRAEAGQVRARRLHPDRRRHLLVASGAMIGAGTADAAAGARRRCG